MPSRPPQVSGSYGVGGFNQQPITETSPKPKTDAVSPVGTSRGEAMAYAFGRALRPVLLLGVLGLGVIYAKDEPSRRWIDRGLHAFTYDPGDCPVNWQGEPISDPELIANSFGTIRVELERRKLARQAAPPTTTTTTEYDPRVIPTFEPADFDNEGLDEDSIALGFSSLAQRHSNNPYLFDDPAEIACDQPSGQTVLQPDAQELYTRIMERTDLRIDFATGRVTANNE